MKTFTRTALCLALAAAVPLSVMADDDDRYDRRGYGGHMGYGMGQGMMRGYGPGMMGGYYDDDIAPIPEDEAKKIFEKFVDKRLKGFKIIEIHKERMPMGTMYWAELKDSNGNEFELHLNPWGRIRGPFVK